MPTESTFLLAGLFFVAAALGYFFARFGDDDEQDEPSEGTRLNSDYIKGLNYVLNEDSDKALEVFMRMVAVDDETLETHFALGSLFRRRGEIDRAIRVHQNIIARPNLGQMHKEQALQALAEDYLSAGLLDRAEMLFRELSASERFKSFALERLLRIYEITREWEQAIEVCRELKNDSSDTASVERMGHYFCELAEQALTRNDFDAAFKWLERAGALPVNRVTLVLADLNRLRGEHAEAIKHYCKMAAAEPRLLVEVVPRLAESCRALDDQDLLTQTLRELRQSSDRALQAIALAVVRDSRISNTYALECLRDYVFKDSVLSQLVDAAQLGDPDPVIWQAAAGRIRQGLASVMSQVPQYRCSECGYISNSLLWQCPGCRSWESLSPSMRFLFTPALTGPVSA